MFYFNSLALKIKLKKIVILSSIFLFFLTLFITSYFARQGIDAHHDGIMFKTALDVASGKTLYTQTYNHYGPISAYLQAFSLQILGNYVLSIRLITAFFYSLIAVVIYLTWTKFMPNKFAFLTSILWLILAPFYTQIFYPWSSVYGLFFLMLSLYLLLVSIKKLNVKNKKVSFHPFVIFAIGATSCLAFLSKQQYLMLIISLISFYILLGLCRVINPKKMMHCIALLCSGFLCVYLLFIFWFYITGSLVDYFKQVLWLGYITGRILGRGIGILELISPLYSMPIWLLLPVVSIYFFVKSLINLMKKSWTQIDVMMLGVSIVSLASIAQYYPISDHSHIFWGATPSIGLLIYIIYIYTRNWYSEKFRPTTKRIVILILFVIFLSNLSSQLVHSIAIGVKRNSYYNTFIKSPEVLKGLKISKSDSIFYSDVDKKINDYLRLNPDKHFVINISDSLYMTFTKKAVNMEPMFLNLSGYTSGIYPFEPKFYEYLETDKPLIIVYSVNSHLHKGYKTIANWDRSGKISLMAPIEK